MRATLNQDQLISLRRAIGRHVGKVLTPEAAAEIEAATYLPQNPIDPDRFAPIDYRGIVVRVERFEPIVDELHALHELHWQETEKHCQELGLHPDYQALIAEDIAGSMVQFTARREGELLGQLRMYLRKSRHSGNMLAEEDVLFVHPKSRGGFLVMVMLRYAERVLIELGVREIYANSKLMNKADVLMRRMGYRPIAIQFHKLIGHEVASAAGP